MGRALGRLQPVELREAWANETADFTPWLAEPQNLNLLAGVIGIEPELEAQEAGVGPFRPDKLCRDNATGHDVLVENQLEKTNHTHLGQLRTIESLQPNDVLVAAVPLTEPFATIVSRWRRAPLLVQSGMKLVMVGRDGSFDGLALETNT